MGDAGPSPQQTMAFKLDEGFAEALIPTDIQPLFASWLAQQSEEHKADIAYEILRTLRCSRVTNVVERLMPLLHMDPLEKLPPEIVQHIFTLLEPKDLLNASLCSKVWRERILDTELWRQLYEQEGWEIDQDGLRTLEEQWYRHFVMRSEFKRARDEHRVQATRLAPPTLRHDKRWQPSGSSTSDIVQWREQHEKIEADNDLRDEIMTNAPAEVKQVEDPIEPLAQIDTSLPLFQDRDGQARLDWPQIYKQRRRLEDNWHHGRCVNFQIPHPDHPEEAHTECVYALQYIGKWMVSGSRDKSVRVWDLDTKRLRGRPLFGHTQSVLCLQFDPRPEENIIISGSSDCTIHVWEFSTGRKLHTIQNAHDESVLSLKFDHRYMVSCSKDKKIKVWNRHSLMPGDPDYPVAKKSNYCFVPRYIVDMSGMDNLMMEARIASGAYRPLQPFTMLMSLEAHSAAVNAVHLFGDHIISASGDRVTRVFNIITGLSTRSITGHNKGIACVQYDGKRIVTGSSDHTIRVFDEATATEVACLIGHTNLVRTIQAHFGSSATQASADLIAARAADLKYRHDLSAGNIVHDRNFGRDLRAGKFGTGRIAFGAKLPPGGGGSRWSRIVSGSYDETIIVWKKDKNDQWVIASKLKQDDAMWTRLREQSRQERLREQMAPLHYQTTTHGMNISNHHSSQNLLPSLGSSSQIYHQMSNDRSSATGPFQTANCAPPTLQVYNSMQARGLQAQFDQAQALSAAQSHILPTNPDSIRLLSTVPVQTVGMPPVHVHQQQQQNPIARGGHVLPTAQAAVREASNRIFKVQFDARRIIACSQDSRIIGWDFANADPEIESCSGLFMGPMEGGS